MEFHFISRFRDDAYLKYISNEAKSNKKGRPKKFDGKIDFNFNASLTTINLSKTYAIVLNKPFSMASIKTMMHNAFLLERFIDVSGIRQNKNLNDRLFKELVEFAAIAA